VKILGRVHHRAGFPRSLSIRTDPIEPGPRIVPHPRDARGRFDRGSLYGGVRVYRIRFDPLHAVSVSKVSLFCSGIPGVVSDPESPSGCRVQTVRTKPRKDLESRQKDHRDGGHRHAPLQRQRSGLGKRRIHTRKLGLRKNGPSVS